VYWSVSSIRRVDRAWWLKTLIEQQHCPTSISPGRPKALFPLRSVSQLHCRSRLCTQMTASDSVTPSGVYVCPCVHWYERSTAWRLMGRACPMTFPRDQNAVFLGLFDWLLVNRVHGMESNGLFGSIYDKAWAEPCCLASWVEIEDVLPVN